jgi:hypothetical protein
MQWISRASCRVSTTTSQNLTPSEKNYNSVQAACCRIPEMVYMQLPATVAYTCSWLTRVSTLFTHVEINTEPTAMCNTVLFKSPLITTKKSSLHRNNITTPPSHLFHIYPQGLAKYIPSSVMLRTASTMVNARTCTHEHMPVPLYSPLPMSLFE